MSPFLYERRNHESSHLDALAAAQQEHERVRQAAIRVYELHELKEEHERIMQQERKEQERLKAEAKIAEEAKRLQELQAKSIPKPAPPPPAPEPAPKAAPQQAQSPAKPAAQNTLQLGSPFAPKKLEPTKVEDDSPLKPQSNGLFSTTPKGEPTSSLFKPALNQNTTTPTSNAFAPKPVQTPAQPPPATAPPKPQAPSAPAAPKDPLLDKYVQIHQELKKLRKELMAQSKVPGSPLKGQMGTFRREIRVSIGQLTAGKGANTQPVSINPSYLRLSDSS